MNRSLLQSLSLLLVVLASSFAQAATDLSELTTLGQSNEWQRILYYVPRWTFKRDGMIDTPGFYLSKDGLSDPVAELQATIAALEAPVPTDPNNHASCLFPRRLKYLKKNLKSHHLNLPNLDCKNYREWREAFPITGASLVFSSNYLNNPSSMYGHTFLRLHRKSLDGALPSPLLDYAINFAANPTTENPVLYPILGLTGRFFGTFSLMPYYLKVQEYNNAESRDLWEFPLNFNEDETDSLMTSLWEVGPHGVRYWYFDENCSFVLLGTIAAAHPSFMAVDHFPNVVSPKDTVTELIAYHALGTPVRRLSALSRFTARRSQLSAAEERVFTKQTNASHLLPEIKDLPKDQAAKILDTIMEWIAFREKLAGNRESTRYKELWNESLSARADLGISSTPLVGPIDVPASPLNGHPAQRFTFASRASDTKNFEGIFGFRFTLHDTLSPIAGYSRDQEITMGDFYADVHKNSDGKVKFYPERGTIVKILSIPSVDFVTRSFAWTLTVGSDRVYGPDDRTWMNYRLEVGAGLAYDLTQNLKLFAIPVLNGGFLDPVSPGLQGGIGGRGGLLFDVNDSLRLGTTADIDTVKASPILRTWSYKGFISKDFGPLWEVRGEWTRRAYRENTGMLAVFKYF